jgi:hypothetical protein
MKRSFLMLGLLLASAPACAAPVNLPLDEPTTVNGIVAVCTGIGSDARQNPAWNAYPLKVLVAGKGGQYLGDEVVAISQGGHELLSVDCGGPWLLFKLAPGTYRVTAESAGVKAESNAHVPASGQGRIILRFPDQGGTISPQHDEKAATGE